MAHQFKIMVVEQMADIILAARKIVVKTDHVIAFGQQAFTKVGTDETGSARY